MQSIPEFFLECCRVCRRVSSQFVLKIPFHTFRPRNPRSLRLLLEALAERAMRVLLKRRGILCNGHRISCRFPKTGPRWRSPEPRENHGLRNTLLPCPSRTRQVTPQFVFSSLMHL